MRSEAAASPDVHQTRKPPAKAAGQPGAGPPPGSPAGWMVARNDPVSGGARVQRVEGERLAVDQHPVDLAGRLAPVAGRPARAER